MISVCADSPNRVASPALEAVRGQLFNSPVPDRHDVESGVDASSIANNIDPELLSEARPSALLIPISHQAENAQVHNSF